MTDFAEAGAHLPAEIINEVIASKNGRVATFDDLEIDYPTPIPGISLVWVEDEQTMRLWDGSNWLSIGEPPKFVKLASNFNKTSSTTLSDVTGFSIELPPGTWALDVHLKAQSASTTPNASIGYRIHSGTATLNERACLGPGATATSVWGAVMRVGSLTTLGGTSYGIPSANTPTSIVENLLITVEATAEIFVQFAQATSNGTASTMLAGSRIEARRVV